MDPRGLVGRRGKASEGAAGDRAVRRGLPCRKRHELKCWPAAFEATVDGDKLFEFRLNDRGYEVGDGLLLREWNPDNGRYTGKAIEAKILYILKGPAFGVPDGYCVMSIRPKLMGKRGSIGLVPK